MVVRSRCPPAPPGGTPDSLLSISLGEFEERGVDDDLEEYLTKEYSRKR